ncbi:MAG: hypothetical protein ACRD18_05695 [Terriglobia bacterium]
MWLLDANMDVYLASLLGEFGIKCETAATRGWRDLSNGKLVLAAESAGFTCLLTRDQLLKESASRALRSFPHFAVVVVGVAQRRWPEYRERFLEAWTASPIRLAPGRVIRFAGHRAAPGSCGASAHR